MEPSSDSDRPRWLSGRIDSCAEGSEVDRREKIRFVRELAPPIAAYLVTLFAVLSIVDRGGAQARNYLILLPTVPVALAARAVYRSLRRIDEYGRMIQVNAMSLGFAVAMVGLVAIGLLGMLDLGFEAAPWLVFLAATLTWGVSSRLMLGRAA